MNIFRRVLLFASFIMLSTYVFSAECPFTLGQICFQPAAGAVYTKSPDGGKYKDLRFAAVLHEKITSGNKHSWGTMVAPGEGFIDAAGFGGVYAFIELEEGYAVLNYGIMAKKFTDPNDVRGGIYLLLSYSLQ